MYKIAVLGEKDSVLGFKALGLDVFVAENEESAIDSFRYITKFRDLYAIVYVTETYYDCLAGDMDKLKDSPTPAVILIPGSGESRGLGLTALEESVERAVGTNLV